MATRPPRLLAAWALLVLLEAPAGGEDFSYSLADDGRPVFTQTLRWKADENALEFELVLRHREEGAEPVEILRERTSEAKAEVQLAPGNYDYMIVTYSLLGKPEDETDWIALGVVKAEMPSISEVAPAVIYVDDYTDGRVTVTGRKLMPDCKVLLVKGEAAFLGAEVQRLGEEELVVLFPAEAYRGGEYGIEVENPGRLRALEERALDIRPPLPAPELVSPPGGFGFGPAELKAQRSIALSWKPVEGATGYRLAVYAKGGGKPIIEKEGLREARYAIEDLSILDRGEFSWKVAAFSRDEKGEFSRKGLESTSAFSIQLARLKRIEARKGGIYFGY